MNDNTLKKKKNYNKKRSNYYSRRNYYAKKRDTAKKVIEPKEEIVYTINNQETNTLVKEEPILRKNTINIENDVKQNEPFKKVKRFTSFGYALGLFALMFIVAGVSYGYYTFNKTDNRNIEMNTGDVYVTSPSNSTLTLTRMYPMTKEEAKERDDNYVTFVVNGKNTSTDRVLEYEIQLENGDNVNGKTRIAPQYMLFELSEVNGNNETVLLSNATMTGFAYYGKILANTTSEVSKTYKLRMWISEEVTISDTDPNATYTLSEFHNLYGNVKVKVVAHDATVKVSGAEKVLAAITENDTGTCANQISYTEDGTTYFSGNNDCINFNYVWYSGKLWRITAIYDDGTMKLVTQNNITSIAYNESGQVDFYTNASTQSYIYQWLNEDFYDTLYQPNNFIDNTKLWNATQTSNVSTKPSETTLVSAKVGLLNSYDYYNSYRNLSGFGNEYLKTNCSYWLLNSYNASTIWYVEYDNSPSNDNPNKGYGVRPAIYLKAGLEFSGSGTSSDPYRLKGETSGQANDLINTRMSGEYVLLKNGATEQLFRIISVENNKTKIVAMNFADGPSNRKFATSTGASNTLWGSGTTTGTDTWYTYLNGTYLSNLETTYGSLFDSGTYYYGTAGYNYKLSVCASATTDSTKLCTKTSQTNSFDIGLPYYGEMFATEQFGAYYVNRTFYMWLINRYSTTNVFVVSYYGSAFGTPNPTTTYGARPTIHLKSTVKILSGKGLENDPYVVGLNAS